jgi:putative DNA primase/helicase
MKELTHQFGGQPVWVAWKNEVRNGKPTKVPHAPKGGRAKADDPDTWGTLAQAEAQARYIKGAVGIILGIDAGDGTTLAGIDLDTCRDAEGNVEDWAIEVIARLATYTEVSPSKTGVKLFFRLREEDLPRIRDMMGSPHGKMFSRRTGENHPPAIELHISNRYFAVTGNLIDRELSEIRLVEFDQIERLLTEAGPKLAGPPHAGADRRATSDGSRSGAAFRLGQTMRSKGATFDEFRDALKGDAELAEWYAEKGADDGERQLHRIWEKAEPIAGPPWKIDPSAPLATARVFRGVEYEREGEPTLWHHRGGFFAWDGAAYPEVEDAEIRAQLYKFLDQCAVPTKKKGSDEWENAPVRPNAALVNNVIDALRAETILARATAPPAWLRAASSDLDPKDIIACENGLLHLPTGDLLPHTPAFFTHNAVPFPYDTAAPEPVEWRAFLRQLWGDDAESIATLQEVFGYCLTADTRQQKAFLIVGPKRSGKGTIGRVLTALVGANNAAAPTLAGIGTNFGLAPLIGKRVAIISDARLGARADQAVISERLLSVTGEDGITIDRKYRDGWTGSLGVRFLILTNELPRLADASGALASRFIVLVLRKSFFGREDMGLTSKLLAELPGILNWSIEGWKRLQGRGFFEQPASANDAIRTLEDLGSPVGAFVRELCEVGPGRREDIVTLYRVWRQWCETEGRDKPGTAASFGRDLKAAVPGLRTRRRNNGDRFYEGITLRRGEVIDFPNGRRRGASPT